MDAIRIDICYFIPIGNISRIVEWSFFIVCDKILSHHMRYFLIDIDIIIVLLHIAINSQLNSFFLPWEIMVIEYVCYFLDCIVSKCIDKDSVGYKIVCAVWCRVLIVLCKKIKSSRIGSVVCCSIGKLLLEFLIVLVYI